MIITKDFILLNNPKTGSTYARQVIKTLYPSKRGISRLSSQVLGTPGKGHLELKHKNLAYPNRPKNQHGTYSQIPSKYLNREIITVIRDPFDKFISAYEYKYYLKHPPSADLQKQVGITKPENITLDQFAQLQIAGVRKRYPHLDSFQIGSQTIQFIHMFFRDPKRSIKSLSPDYFSTGAYKQDLPDIHFLNQSALSSELFDYLEGLDLEPDGLSKARQIGRVNENKRRPDYKEYTWTNDALNYVKTYERFLLLMLKELGFDFKEPSPISTAHNSQ